MRTPSQPTPPPRLNIDQTLKRLLERGHEGFLALVAPSVKWIANASAELPDGTPGVYHIELQVKVESDIETRLAGYFTRIYDRERAGGRLSARTLIVYLREGGTIPEPPFVVDWMGRESLRFEYDVLKIWEVPSERVLAIGDPEVWPLAGLMADLTIDRAAEVAERIAESPLPRPDQAEIIDRLVMLAGTHLPWRALMDSIRARELADELWEWSSMGREYHDAIQAEALEEGRAKGRAEGAEQGKHDAMRQMARVALEGRFGALPADTLAALETADEATLTALVAHIASDTPAESRARLGLS